MAYYSSEVHPLAIEVMKDLDIDISANTPHHTSIYEQTQFDRVITLCGSAAEECQIWLGYGKTTHIGFEDPAKFVGSPDETIAFFRQIRDEIRSEVLVFLENGQPTRTQ